MTTCALLAGCSDGSSSGDADAGVLEDLHDAAGEGQDIGEVDDAIDAPDTAPPLTFDDNLPAEVREELQTILQSRLPHAHAPGATLTVAHPDWGTAILTAGYAILDPPTPVHPDDIFRMGSITKQFVAAIILQLQEEGVLSLDDPVNDWVQGFDLASEITIERLLNHSSGLYDFTDAPSFIIDSQEPIQPRALVEYALGFEPRFPPGESWSYSNTNYILLGMIVEEATGVGLAQSIRERLLVPLNLRHMWLEPDEEFDGLVDGHTSGAENTHFTSMTWAWAAGAMASRGPEMCEWTRALHAGEVVDDESLTQMTTRYEPADLSDARYGLGLQFRVRGGAPVIGHTGSTMGFRNEMFFHPPTHTCVVIQTNDFVAVPLEIAEPAWNAILDAQHYAR